MMYIDATGNPALGGAFVKASFVLNGVVKTTDSKATFFTSVGAKVHIDGVAQAGTIELEGVLYSISDRDEESQETRRGRGLIRGGGFLTTSELEHVSASRALCVIILAQPGDSSASDARTLRTVLVLKSLAQRAAAAR